MTGLLALCAWQPAAAQDLIFATNTYLAATNPVSVVAADVNGDGKPDLITANSGDNTLTVLINETVFPAPTLNIESASPNIVVVSWSSPLTGLALQTNLDLTTTNWRLPDYLIATHGSIKSVTLSPPPAENLFFRMKQQLH
jgi:hypothetical protein